MDLQKSSIDIGLRTNRLEPMLAFWQQEAGLAFQGLLPIMAGQEQHRHDANGSVIKVNKHDDPLPDVGPTGYRELIIAREGLAASRTLTDPEGTRLRLVPPGEDGVTQLGVVVAVRDLDRHRRFYADALDLPEEQPGRFRSGESLIILEQAADVDDDAQMYGPGFRYITFQVNDGVGAFERMIARGGSVGRQPMIANTASVVSVSMGRDPDGNWVEILERP